MQLLALNKCAGMHLTAFLLAGQSYHSVSCLGLIFIECTKRPSGDLLTGSRVCL